MLRLAPGPALAGLLFVALATATACGGGPAASGPGRQAWERLCEATAAARSGDRDAARSTFEDAHPHLHTLAEEVAEIDAEVSADLLEAKQRVESDLSKGGSALATDLAGLVTATNRAVRATGEQLPDSCVAR